MGRGGVKLITSVVGVDSGIRGGELCGLGVSDVDLQNRVIKVWRSAWRGTLQTPKTNNAVRHFPISANLAEHIRQYLNGDWKSNPDGLLFSTRRGKPLDNYNVVTWQLKPLLERLGITDTRRMGLHAFRHCNATELDRMGAPIKVRQDRLGHADSETTFGYTHAASEDHRRVAAELGRIFDPNTLSTEAVEKPSENVGIPCLTLPKSPVSDRNVRELCSSSVGA